ncbi:membrane protein [Bacillus coahuilensis p1.1.43]|uniref:Membrane protein n=1 Tax=Bacillus coahuilensis p1.1.43 TaxID=1150625 RepID=A0A147KC36_9BACI|nr:TspO/MBR family protein [Bacillus coahuilensis]KUP09116.1 membrane protein [Bacillus coahuilensis p1.1.43]
MKRFILYLVFFLLVIIVNALSNTLPFNGKTTGEIANSVQVLFQPAGYVFSIWSLIYLTLGVWILRQLPKSRIDLPMYDQALVPFIISCILNCTWIFMWHYEYFAVSVVVMLALLLTIIWLYVTVKSTGPSFFDLLPFSLYIGWISVATIANISFTLEYYDWNGLGLSDVTWTIILLVVGTLFALFFTKKENDFVYPLVFVWAFIGIGVKNQEVEPVVAYTSFILAGVILIGMGYLFAKRSE